MDPRKNYLVVDGYNIINDWPSLKKLSEHSLEEARESLIAMMQSFAKVKSLDTIIVFDAYNNDETAKEEDVDGVKVVFSGKNQTADSYIEKLMNTINPLHEVTAATSDFMLQRMIIKAGGTRMSARELQKEVEFALNFSMKKIRKESEVEKNSLLKNIDEKTIQKLKSIHKE
ncbi:MAG: NYN domain-containing protein [Eubacteriaceae bacterium]|nr:NYN domain-containing protein [Eubacteriaceae bacterium]